LARVAVGVDLGGTNVRMGLVTQSGEIIARRKGKTRVKDGPEKVVGRLIKTASGLIEKARSDGHRVAGLGIGCPGIITADGVVKVSPNLTGWVDLDLAGQLSGGLRTKVRVENDANAYALGESWLGAGRGAESLVVFTLGTGVGGGIILAGKLWRGVDGMAGEVGHITVNPNGRQCGCGNRGCLEAYSSATAVVERTVEALRGGRFTTLSSVIRQSSAEMSALKVMEAALSGDMLAKTVYSEAGKYLGIAVADLVNLLNIERIVIGGGMAGAWGLMEEAVNYEVYRRAFKVPAERCEIVTAQLGDDAGILGSAGLALGKLE